MSLNERQKMVLFHLCAGRLNKEISFLTGITPRMVDKIIHQLKHKIGVETRIGLVRWAIESGFLRKLNLYANNEKSCL